MGITEKIESKKKLGLFSELSVTGLSTIVECPRKFYLKNVCKIKFEENFFIKKRNLK